jgi:DNA replication protein DnaC
MTAFLKIDNCNGCKRPLPWEFVPAVLLNGKPMAGTGVWRSQLIEGRCPACQAAFEAQHQNEQRSVQLRRELIQLLGGEKPYREFTFERYEVTPGNRLAYERCQNFNSATENLYLWGPCGVGKAHLAYATARRGFEQMLSVAIVRIYQLSRKIRMKDPEQEQEGIDQLAQADILVLDELSVGPHTAYTRQLLQEILDERHFADRAGLIVTSPYSLRDLAAKLSDDTIPSRLAGMCQVTEVRGHDFRLTIRKEVK